jgi:mannose-6-phosphate isomerase
MSDTEDWMGAETLNRLRNAKKFEEFSTSLKHAYTILMSAPQDRILHAIENIIQSNILSDRTALEWISKLHNQFPGGDVGVLSVLFLNIVHMQPGTCLFIGPNVPHAYLYGDLVECMTCSDNVIRGGLTPKFKDVNVLVSSLDYMGTIPRFLEPLIAGTNSKGTTWIPPGVPFAVKRYLIEEGSTPVTHKCSKNLSILLVVSGNGRIDERQVVSGTTLILSPNRVIQIFPEPHIDVFIAYDPRS